MAFGLRIFPFRLLVALAVAVLPGSAAHAAPPVEIELQLFLGGEGEGFYGQAARDFQRLRPDIRVNLSADPRVAEKARIRILEGTFFEITNAPTLNYWPLIRNGDVLALDKYLDGPNWEGDATWRSTFLPGSLDQYVYRGQTYGVPLPYYVSGLFYNKGMFAERGWKPPATWQELIDLCQRIQATGIAPIAFQGRYPLYAFQLVDTLYHQLAGDPRWRQQKELLPGCYDNPEYIRALDLVQQLATHYFQPGCMGMSHTEAQLQFFSGGAAMIPCGAWLKAEMLGKIPAGFQFGFIALPRVADAVGDPTAVPIFAMPYFIMSHSGHPEAAVEFLRYLTSRQVASRYSQLTDIPAAVRGSQSGLSSDMADLVQAMQRARTSFGTTPGEGYPEMEQYYQDEMYNLITTRRTPIELARQMESAAATVRTRAQHPERITINHTWKPGLLIGLLGLAGIYWLWTTARSWKRIIRQADPAVGALQRMGWRNLLLFLGPALVIYCAFIISPSARSFIWSVHEWDGISRMDQAPLVGMRNYARLLFESDPFWIALRNNLFLMVVIPLFIIPIALFLATCISRGVWGAGLYRIVFFFPNLMGGVAVTLLWLHLYNPQGGLVNTAIAAVGQALSGIGLERIGAWFIEWKHFAWLAPDHLYWALVPMSIWGACGFNMILYLAAMESVPQSLYESATIDGASRWRQFWGITLPLIWDVLSISIVFMVIGGMKAFEVIWLLTNQRPTTETHVIGTRLVQTMFNEYKVGEAAAIAVLLFVMVFLGTAATLRIMRRETVEM